MGLTEPGPRWIGPLCAVLGVVGFSLKAILVKLAYAWHPLDAVTLLALRMIYSLPFFVAMAWWSGRRPGARAVTRRDGFALLGLGFVGYYFSSLLDFAALAHISAALERLVLFLHPTIVVVLSALVLGKRVTRRTVLALVVSYAGIAFVVGNDLRLGEPGAVWTGSALAFGAALAYAVYLVGAGGVIARLGSMRFIAWAMIASTVFVLAHFALAREVALLAVPLPVHALVLAMALFSTVLPTWFVAEAVRRIGANTSALVGSLGPALTIGLAALFLGEPVHGIQLVGAALVMGGVMLVTLRPERASGPGANAAATGS